MRWSNTRFELKSGQGLEVPPGARHQLINESSAPAVNLNQVTLPARDVAESVAFYKRMGFELIVDAPHYARFKCPQGDASFSVYRVEAAPKASAVVVYFEDAALDETVKALQAKGIQFTQEPRDEPWLWREARTQDPSGNVICLYWAGVNRLHPPWRAEP